MSKYIDFHDPNNRDTYVGRDADPEWTAQFVRATRPAGKVLADIGCGGGIYTRAMAETDPAFVVGVDSSSVSLRSARQYLAGVGHVGLVLTDAERLAIRSDALDVIVERALIHHMPTLDTVFAEALRVLRPSGVLWVQDRTVEDALLPASQEHIRGYYMVFDQRLRNTEIERRRTEHEVTAELLSAGFATATSMKIQELRKVFRTPDDLADEILTRRGRSILHKLDDRRLSELADYVVGQITEWPVRERDTWTVWIAAK